MPIGARDSGASSASHKLHWPPPELPPMGRRIEPDDIKQRAQQPDPVTAQVNAAVVKRIAQPEAGAIKHDRAASG